MSASLREELPRRLREMRVHKGKSVQALSEASGLSETYLKRLEAGKANPSVEALCKVAESLGYDLEITFLAKAP